MAIISRSELDHPALGTAGGTSLHTSIETIYTTLGDNDISRFFIQNALANTSSVDFDHNFKCAFSQLSYLLFLRDTGTGELTRIDSLSSPSIGQFTIAATPGNLTTQIRVTNNSGASRDLALIVMQDGGAVTASAFTYIVKSANYTAVAGDKILTDSSGGAFTITLPLSASFGHEIEVFDATESWVPNNVTISRNGHNINGAAADFICNVDNGKIRMIYHGVTQGWRVYP
jgi:hypothetical protein